MEVIETESKNNLPLGTVLQLHGYDNPKFVIVENLGINEKFDSYGTKYRTIQRGSLEYAIYHASDLEFIQDKRDGRIQTYITDERMNEQELSQLRSRAEEKLRSDQEATRKKYVETDFLIETGKDLFKAFIPETAKALIVAELIEDESDIMTDYWGHKTTRLVILDYSMHTKNLFPEMRKAAAKFHETKPLAVKNEKFEHRENYSMGAGYYLKDEWIHLSGWCIRKADKYHGWRDEHYISIARTCLFIAD